jgi:putative addiction module killer protein
VPYTEWICNFDSALASRIDAYVDRMRTGNFGNSQAVGEGVSELKINYGSGYRIYYLRDKRSQEEDIRRARGYATDYWNRQ